LRLESDFDRLKVVLNAILRRESEIPNKWNFKVEKMALSCGFFWGYKKSPIFWADFLSWIEKIRLNGIFRLGGKNRAEHFDG